MIITILLLLPSMTLFPELGLVSNHGFESIIWPYFSIASYLILINKSKHNYCSISDIYVQIVLA